MGQFRIANANTAAMIYRSGALAAALTGIMPLDYDSGARTQFGIGVGSYHGNTAMAVGINHYVNDSTLLNAGMAFSGSDTMYRGGVTFRFGRATKRVAARVDTTEIDNLKQQLQQQQNELLLLKRQMAELVNSRRAEDTTEAANYKR
jgi:hypothetical protein